MAPSLAQRVGAALVGALSLGGMALADEGVAASLQAARLDFEEALVYLESSLADDAHRARDLLTSVVTVAHQADAGGLEAEALYALGIATDRLGDPAGALAPYRRALLLQQAFGDRRGEAATRNNLGLILAEIGRPNEALAHLESALTLRRAASDLSGEAASVHNLAALHLQLGEHQAALDHYQRALELHRQLDDPPAEAAALNNIGLVFAQLGEPERADQHYHRALALHRVSGNLSGEAGTLANLGLSSLELERPALALAHLGAARRIYRTLGDRAAEGDVLANLGLVYLETQQPELAQRELEAALTIQQQLGNRRGEAAVRNNLGRLERQKGRFGPARAHLDRALELQHQLQDPWAISFALLELAQLEVASGRLEKGRATIEAAVAVVESVRSEIASPSHRATWLGSRREIYDFRVEVLMRLDQLEPSGGHRDAALLAAEAARARSFAESLDAARAARPDASRSGVDERRDLRRRLSALDGLRRQLLREGQAPRAAVVDEEIEVLLAEDRRLDSARRSGDPDDVDWQRPEPLTIAALRQLLDRETVLLVYSLRRERGTLWVVTRESIRSFELPGRESVEQAALRLHELASRSRERAFRGPARVAAAELAEKVLAPARESLSSRRIVVVADGALEYVPFAALPLVGQPLGMTHEVIAVPSVSVLAALRRASIAATSQQTASPRKANRPTIAILADPVFDPEDPRLPLESSALAPSVPAATVPSPPSRLLHSRREAEVVAAMVPAEQRLLALDFAARRDLLIGGGAKPYSILHLATHGVLDTRRPELSSLLFSRLDSEGRPIDGHLRLFDIYHLQLDAELVVLSACRTALGREIRGDGLQSLARGFLHAGARRVVVSLWNVDDEATAVLMEHFYRKLLQDGQSAGAALRSARARVASDPRWQAPYYWAGFVLQGDWR